MSININTFRKQLLNTTNKWRSGHLPPSRQNDFLQQASIELFNEKVLSASKSNKLDDDLAPFLKSKNINVSTPAGLNYGLLLRPSDYNKFWSIRAFFSGNSEDNLVSCGCPSSEPVPCDAVENLPVDEVPVVDMPILKEVNVTKVDGSQWSAVLMHRSKMPTLDNPYCTQYDAGFKVAPRNITVVTMDYYRLPTEAIFGYVLLSGNYYQYDPSTSVNIEWPATVLDELLDRTVRIFSNYLRDPEMRKFAIEQMMTRT